MKYLKDKKIIILMAILVVFTIGYFVIANKISYAFVNSIDTKESYKQTVDIIKKGAIAYGEKNKNLFEKENIVYIKVQDLIDNELLATNEKGNISNPLKENETLNSNVIKLKYENEKFDVEIDS